MFWNGAFWWMKAVQDVKLEEFFNSFSIAICQVVLIVNDLISVELYTRFYNHFFIFLFLFCFCYLKSKNVPHGFFSFGTGFHQSPVIILISNQLAKIPFLHLWFAKGEERLHTASYHLNLHE